GPQLPDRGVADQEPHRGVGGARTEQLEEVAAREVEHHGASVDAMALVELVREPHQRLRLLVDEDRVQPAPPAPLGGGAADPLRGAGDERPRAEAIGESRMARHRAPRAQRRPGRARSSASERWMISSTERSTTMPPSTSRILPVT